MLPKSPAELMRSDLRSLRPYQSHVIPGNVKLDANENPFPWPEGMKEAIWSEEIACNRYPDGEAKALRQALSVYTGIPAGGILAGNGSDELIQVILATFGGPGTAVVIHPPTFSMYEAAARVTGTEVRCVPLILKRQDSAGLTQRLSGGVSGPLDLALDVPGILAQAQDERVKVIIICNPNNPTGTLFPREDILKIVRETGKIVIVDEAYAEFSGVSLVDEIANCPNLIVLRTFSKAFAMAGLRLGYLLAQESTVDLINRVRQPFNVNVFTQAAGRIALNYVAEFRRQVAQIKEETAKLWQAIRALPGVEVFVTHANFVLFKPGDAEDWQRRLAELGFTVRYMGDLPVVGKCLRVSAGLPEENRAFLETLYKLAAS